MGLFDFFTSKKTPPQVVGNVTGGFLINYNTSFDVFFKFYRNNPYIANVINKIMRDTAAHGFEIQTTGERTIKGALEQFEQLLQVSTPYTVKGFIERLVRDFELTGNAYVYFELDGNTVKGIQALDPRYTKPITNSQGTVLGYLQNLKGLRTFTKDEVLHFRDGNDPDNESIGYAKMNSLFLDLETDRHARESNLAFFKNNQTPASLVIIDPEFTTTDENGIEDVNFAKRIKEIFNSGANAGGENAHKTMYVEGVKDIIKVQDKITDMEFINLRKFTRELVNTAYEITPDAIGITENSNKSTGVVQSAEYHKRIERENEIFQAFLTKIVQKIDNSWQFVIFQDDLTLLAIKSEIAGSLYEKGLLQRNEAREIIQYPPTEDGNNYRAEGKSSTDITSTTDTQKK